MRTLGIRVGPASYDGLHNNHAHLSINRVSFTANRGNNGSLAPKVSMLYFVEVIVLIG